MFSAIARSSNSRKAPASRVRLARLFCDSERIRGNGVITGSLLRQPPMTAPRMDIDELLALPVVVDLRTAARAFGLGQDKAYTLARRGEFPCRVERWGYEYPPC